MARSLLCETVILVVVAFTSDGNCQTCYTQKNCIGDIVTEPNAASSADECCFSDAGMSYEDTSGLCVEGQCAVIGFVNRVENLTESGIISMLNVTILKEIPDFIVAVVRVHFNGTAMRDQDFVFVPFNPLGFIEEGSDVFSFGILPLRDVVVFEGIEFVDIELTLDATFRRDIRLRGLRVNIIDPTGPVTITDPLQFTLQTAPTVDPPVFTLTCVSAGGPATTVNWMRDGVAVTIDTSQTQVDEQTSTYHNILTVNGRLLGIYECNVTNERNFQPAAARLIVAVAPSSPTDLEAFLFTGNNTIVVSWTPPSGSPTHTGYMIYYNATSGEADMGSITFGGASIDEIRITGRTRDEYTVSILVLTDQLPSTVTETTTIKVKSPVIIDQPDSLQFVVPKQPVTFTVNATGDNLMYEWQMDGIAICGAKTATYTIETVSESDEGMYWCVVSNAADSITSTAASLTVLDPPIVVVPDPDALMVVGIGQKVVLNCSVISSVLPEVEWTGPVSVSGSTPILISGMYVSTIVIDTAGEEHRGVYFCLASNNAGSTTETRQGTLYVVAVSVEDMTGADLGTNTSFTCTITGDPTSPLTFMWSRVDGRFDDRITGMNTSVLSISNTGVGDEGMYECTVSFAGADLGIASGILTIASPTKTSTLAMAVGISIGMVTSLLVMAIIVTSCAICCLRRTKTVDDENVLNTDQLYGMTQLMKTSMVISSNNIRLLDSIGEGEFGIVYKAHLIADVKEMPELVAVKTMKYTYDANENSALLKESMRMKDMDHPNVLGLIGVCVDAGPAPYLVMPYMVQGSLLSYLKKHRSDIVFFFDAAENNEEKKSKAEKKLADMCVQIAKGMEYLTAHQLVHRDLAARNCMLNFHGVIKVADFGLTEKTYSQNYFRQGIDSKVKLPIKWMAPESMSDGLFTEATDVWSFGVTCWEVYSGGSSPYPGIDPFTLQQQLLKGKRLVKPLNSACGDEVYEKMFSCWKTDPAERPTFSQLVVSLSRILEQIAGYFDLAESYEECHYVEDKFSLDLVVDERYQSVERLASRCASSEVIESQENDQLSQSQQIVNENS